MCVCVCVCVCVSVSFFLYVFLIGVFSFIPLEYFVLFNLFLVAFLFTCLLLLLGGAKYITVGLLLISIHPSITV